MQLTTLQINGSCKSVDCPSRKKRLSFADFFPFSPLKLFFGRRVLYVTFVTFIDSKRGSFFNNFGAWKMNQIELNFLSNSFQEYSYCKNQWWIRNRKRWRSTEVTIVSNHVLAKKRISISLHCVLPECSEMRLLVVLQGCRNDSLNLLCSISAFVAQGMNQTTDLEHLNKPPHTLGPWPHQVYHLVFMTGNLEIKIAWLISCMSSTHRCKSNTVGKVCGFHQQQYFNAEWIF